MKKILFVILFICFFSISVYSADYTRGKLPSIANPAWVYPWNRKFYKGYEKKKNKKKTSPDWAHSTNRPTGNNKGGGSIYYWDYRSIRQRTSPGGK